MSGVIHLFNDIWKITLFKKGLNWKLIISFGVPGVIATYFGASFIFNAPEELLSRILGVFLIAYVIFLFFKPTFKVKPDYKPALIGGALSGFSAGIFGLGGAIRSAFLSAYDLPKSVYIATIGVIALSVDFVRVSTYLYEGAWLPHTLLPGLILFIPASFYGARIAKEVVGKIPQKKFRLVIAVFLLVAAVKLLVYP